MCISDNSSQGLAFLQGQKEYTKGLVINKGEGGGLQNRKIAGLKLFAPPPPPTPSRDRAKRFPPPLKEWERFVPPFSIAKI